MGMFSLSTDTRVSTFLRERESEVSEVEEVVLGEPVRVSPLV